jgi:putative oxidoreductase
MAIITPIICVYRAFGAWCTRYFSDLSSLTLRLIVAKVFINSGLLKWNGWFNFDEQQYDLFLYEFFCPDPIRENALLLCNPDTLDYAEGASVIGLIKFLAISSGVLEVLLPVLLILGLFTRLGALGLIGMTLFIQLAVFPSWEHWWNPAAWWAVVLFAIFAHGPGRFSLDHLFGLERSTKK